MVWGEAVRSAELFEVFGGSGDFEGQCAEFADVGAVFGGGDDVFGGAAKLEEAVLEGGDFGVREDDGVFGESAALECGAAFVGALAAGLAAVAATAADVAAFGEAPSAPAAVPGRASAARDEVDGGGLG
jgi:hypothetical protein